MHDRMNVLYACARPGERVSFMSSTVTPPPGYVCVVRIEVPTLEDAVRVYDVLTAWPPELLDLLGAYEVTGVRR